MRGRAQTDLPSVDVTSPVFFFFLDLHRRWIVPESRRTRALTDSTHSDKAIVKTRSALLPPRATRRDYCCLGSGCELLSCCGVGRTLFPRDPNPISMAVFLGKTTSRPGAMKCE